MYYCLLELYEMLYSNEILMQPLQLLSAYLWYLYRNVFGAPVPSTRSQVHWSCLQALMQISLDVLVHEPQSPYNGAQFCQAEGLQIQHI